MFKRRSFPDPRRAAWLGVAAVLVVAAIATATEVSLVLWLAALLGAVQLAYLIAIAALFRRARAGIPGVTAEPWADLVPRIDALDRALARREQDGVVPWRDAQAFDALVAEARARRGVADVQPGQGGAGGVGDAAGRDVATVRAMLEDLRRSLT